MTARHPFGDRSSAGTREVAGGVVDEDVGEPDCDLDVVERAGDLIRLADVAPDSDGLGSELPRSPLEPGCVVVRAAAPRSRSSHPSRANSIAMPLPSPVPPPVTMTTLAVERPGGKRGRASPAADRGVPCRGHGMPDAMTDLSVVPEVSTPNERGSKARSTLRRVRRRTPDLRARCTSAPSESLPVLRRSASRRVTASRRSFRTRIEHVDLIFACARLGAIHVPVNVFLKGEFLQLSAARRAGIGRRRRRRGHRRCRRRTRRAPGPASSPSACITFPTRAFGGPGRRSNCGRHGRDHVHVRNDGHAEGLHDPARLPHAFADRGEHIARIRRQATCCTPRSRYSTAGRAGCSSAPSCTV